MEERYDDRLRLDEKMLELHELVQSDWESWNWYSSSDLFR